ncbi:MAG TPA: hypothetical protein ENH85_03395 [Candidatus Scalindua sp.]|nr:hypothetical protein [Candidatus Scalindua sp.]
MEKKTLRDLHILPDSALAGFEKNLAIGLKKSNVECTLEVLKGFREGVRFARESLHGQKHSPETYLNITMSGVTKLITKKEGK